MLQAIMNASQSGLRQHHVMRIAAIVATLFASACASAAEIHKCAGGGSVSYQTEACGSGQRQLALLTTSSDVPRRDAPRVDVGNDTGNGRTAGRVTQSIPGRQWLPFEHRSVVAGMTDDEVLNSSGGGVPTRITRVRDGKTWRETWIYATRAGAVRTMQFVNGRLESTEEGADIAQLHLAGTP